MNGGDSKEVGGEGSQITWGLIHHGEALDFVLSEVGNPG
jgi:hypothetical protein